MTDTSSRIWLMTQDDQQDKVGRHKKPVVIKGSSSGVAAASSQPWDTPTRSLGQTSSVYRRLRHWVRSLLRSRIMPSDVSVVKGVNQPLLKDLQDIDGEETK